MNSISTIPCFPHPVFVNLHRIYQHAALLIAVVLAICSTATPGIAAVTQHISSVSAGAGMPAEGAQGWGNTTTADLAQSSGPGLPRQLLWCLVAATAAFLLYKFRCTAHNKVVSQFGEIKTVHLPDHSEVTLNANSRIRYARRWRKGATREVWLDGEAFFDVRPHDQRTPGLLVHTRGMDVEASGASFNIKDRRDKTVVVLNSGKAKLCLNTEPLREAQLNPGEKIAYHLHEKRMMQSEVNTAAWCGWRHNVVVLDELTVQEIAELIEDNYGIQVAIDDQALANRKLRGRVVANNLQEVVAVLKNALRVGIAQPDHQAGGNR